MIVFTMRHNFSYINTFGSVLCDDDNAVIVPCYVKHHIGWYIVDRVEELTNVSKIPKVRLLNNRMPLTQS